MATYFVDSGRADDTGSGLTWALAKKTIQAALTAASSGTDVVVIKSTVDHTLAADTTFTTANSVAVIAATADDAGTAYTPTAMGASNWIGHNTTSYYIYWGGTDDKVFLWGLTFRTAGSTAKAIRFATGGGDDYVVDNCLLWQSGTGAGATSISYGGTTTAKNCTFTFAAAGQSLLPSIAGAFAYVENCSVATTSPTTLILGAGGVARFIGCDLSVATGTIVGNLTASADITLDRCKLGTGAVSFAAQSTNPTRNSAQLLIIDCSDGDTHGRFEYWNALGSVVTDSTIKTSAGAAGQSWKITTTSYATFLDPFITPWISLYNTGTSAITPRLEVVRTGSSTAYKNSEIWSEWAVKTNAGFTTVSFTDDRQALATYLAGTAGADQDTGALGASDWDAEGSPAWFGKLESASVTPDEAGWISARVCVGLASIAGTLYVDPQIRT